MLLDRKNADGVVVRGRGGVGGVTWCIYHEITIFTELLVPDIFHASRQKEWQLEVLGISRENYIRRTLSVTELRRSSAHDLTLTELRRASAYDLSLTELRRGSAHNLYHKGTT